MKPRYVVVHHCSDAVREVANEAMDAKRRYREHMERAQEQLDLHLQKKMAAFQLIAKEYPPIADPEDPGVFDVRRCVIVLPVTTDVAVNGQPVIN